MRVLHGDGADEPDAADVERDGTGIDHAMCNIKRMVVILSLHLTFPLEQRNPYGSVSYGQGTHSYPQTEREVRSRGPPTQVASRAGSYLIWLAFYW